MATRKPRAMYFSGVAAAGKARAVVAGHLWAHEQSGEQVTAAHLIEGGEWRSLRGYTGIVHAVRHDPGARFEFLLAERAGTLYRVSAAAEFEFETISETREGFVMDLRKIGSHWYVAGGQRQVLRKEGSRWRGIDDGILVPTDEGHALLLQSIAGPTEQDIYGVGSGGAMFRYDGHRWRELESPTDYDLERVLCVSEDETWVCGEGGSLYRGDGDTWRALLEPAEDVTFWDMARFRDRIYVCTDKQLFVIDDDEPTPVEIDVDGPLEFYRLDAGDTDLWAIGGECVLQFDGRVWRQHVCPDNT